MLDFCILIYYLCKLTTCFLDSYSNKTDKYYIEVSLSSFNAEDDSLDDTPVYLYDDNIWNDVEYVF